MSQFKQKLWKALYNIIDGFSPLFVPIVKFMAFSGAGSKKCINSKCLSMQVHYYSPIPDIDDLNERKIWDKTRVDDCIDLNMDFQRQLIAKLGTKYGAECDWRADPIPGVVDFYTENNSFSFGCAAAVYCLIRELKPKRIIEVGSGNSSLIIDMARMKNSEEQNYECKYIVIDLYPRKEIIDSLASNNFELKCTRVELVDIDFFSSLSKDDILFIDSGHTCKIGGDVNYLILDVLPLLNKGVYIHFHDIPYPFEYQKEYYINPKFRVFWTESYLLQAFLSYNKDFKVILSMQYFMHKHLEDFKNAFPHYDPEKHLLGSGSFWIKKNKYVF